MQWEVFTEKRYVPVFNAILIGCLGLFLCLSPVDAKTKKLDDKITEQAEALAKDREAAFTGEKAMSAADFQKSWTEFAKVFDGEYAGHTVELKTFGTDVRSRKVYTHFMYNAFRMQQKSVLNPSPQEFVVRHPFLQELMTEGSCYTGGDPFPKKMKDLLKANNDMIMGLRDHLDKWDVNFRKKFEKEYGEGK